MMKFLNDLVEKKIPKMLSNFAGKNGTAVALLQLRRVEVPLHIHGRPLRHHAHQADVLRLQILLEQGGIYLDMDTIVVRPLLPAHLQSTAAMLGIQDSPRIYAGSTRANGARIRALSNQLRRPHLLMRC